MDIENIESEDELNQYINEQITELAEGDKKAQQILTQIASREIDIDKVENLDELEKLVDKYHDVLLELEDGIEVEDLQEVAEEKKEYVFGLYDKMASEKRARKDLEERGYTEPEVGEVPAYMKGDLKELATEQREIVDKMAKSEELTGQDIEKIQKHFVAGSTPEYIKNSPVFDPMSELASPINKGLVDYVSETYPDKADKILSQIAKIALEARVETEMSARGDYDNIKNIIQKGSVRELSQEEVGFIQENFEEIVGNEKINKNLKKELEEIKKGLEGKGGYIEEGRQQELDDDFIEFDLMDDLPQNIKDTALKNLKEIDKEANGKYEDAVYELANFIPEFEVAPEIIAAQIKEIIPKELRDKINLDEIASVERTKIEQEIEHEERRERFEKALNAFQKADREGQAAAPAAQSHAAHKSSDGSKKSIKNLIAKFEKRGEQKGSNVEKLQQRERQSKGARGV